MGQPASQVNYPFAITGYGVLSAIGVGPGAFTNAIRAGKSGRQPTENHFNEQLPVQEACFIPDFKASTFLGKKGTAFLDRTTALVMAACGMALESAQLPVTDEDRGRIGLVVGTSTGSVKSISDYARDPLVQEERPYLVNPLIFPNTVMNCAAGQSAIRYQLKGVNATVAGGQLSSILALRYATMAIRQRYADVLLVGAVEEFSPQVAWGFDLSGVLRETETVPGEGCAIFVVEATSMACAAGRTPLAELLACEVGVYHKPSEGPTRLAESIRRALTRAGVTADQVGSVAGSMTGDHVLDRLEEEGISLALGSSPTLLKVKQLLGECYSAAGVLQLAALLAIEPQTISPEKPIALVTSMDHAGSTGCLVVRRWL